MFEDEVGPLSGWGIALTIFCVITISVSSCVRGNRKESLEDSYHRKEVIPSHIENRSNEMASKEKEIDKLMYFYNKLQDDTLNELNSGILISLISDAISTAQDEVSKKQSGIEKLQEEFVKYDENYELSLKSDMNWHDDFRKIFYFLTGCSIGLFILGMLDFDEIQYRQEKKVMENPRKIYIIPLAKGGYQVAFKRWFKIVKGERFDKHEEAITYVDNLNGERIMKNWHEIK